MINWGIIGLGNIAHTFAEAIKEISIKRDGISFEQAVKNFSIEKVTDQYLELIK